MKPLTKCVITLALASLPFVSCERTHDDDINIELTVFAQDLVNAYADTPCHNTSIDSTYSFVFRCYKNSICLFGYSGFSHKDLVGKALLGGRLVKIYGSEKPSIYKRLHKTRDKEMYDTDGNYVEDLKAWALSTSSDTIFIDICDCNDQNVLIIRDVCKKHFPNNILIWRRTSFLLEGIRL